MKVGDLVAFKNLGSSWPSTGLIVRVHKTHHGTGQIHLMTTVMGNCTIPWIRRDYYMEVISD